MPHLSMDLPIKNADLISIAVGIEAHNSPFGERVNIEGTETSLHLEIYAQNLSGLRAAVHSYIPWIDMAERITEVIGR